MDADTLRIILIVFGALVLAGLYLWERRKARAEEDEDLDEDADDAGLDRDKREPRLGRFEENADEVSPRGKRAAPEQPELKLEPPLGPKNRVPEPPPTGPMILTLNVSTQGEPFDGAAIVHAAGRCGLEPGDMEIYHCVLGEGVHRQILFSMANMVKPGTFPFGAMAEFQTPGLTLFAELDGTPDDPGRMEEMIGTAFSLAADLGGEVLDAKRNSLTPEAERTLRERVMAFVQARLAAEGK
jgi:cell division protein ZipA